MRRMKFGPGFHQWAQTVSTIVQAIAVVGGVGFAVFQLSGQQWEHRQRQIEATMDYLRQLDSEPVHSSYQGVLAWATILVPEPSPEEFQKTGAPFGVFLHGLAVCIQTAVCDSRTAIDWMCPAAIDYYAESVKANFEPDAFEVLSRIGAGGQLHTASMAIGLQR